MTRTRRVNVEPSWWAMGGTGRGASSSKRESGDEGEVAVAVEDAEAGAEPGEEAVSEAIRAGT